MTSTSVDALREAFRAAPFIASLGLELESVAAGCCHTSLRVLPHHLQQNAVVHAGVIATMADHTAGAAAWSALPAGSYPLTVEFKINLLRATTSPVLQCRSQVLKAGRNIVVAESEIFSVSDDKEELVAKAMVTLAVLASEVRQRAS